MHAHAILAHPILFPMVVLSCIAYVSVFVPYVSSHVCAYIQALFFLVFLASIAGLVTSHWGYWYNKAVPPDDNVSLSTPRPLPSSLRSLSLTHSNLLFFRLDLAISLSLCLSLSLSLSHCPLGSLSRSLAFS